MFVKNLFQSLNFPIFDKPNFSTGFIYNLRPNFYCCLGQIRDISVQNTLKMAKILNSYKFYAQKNRDFPVEKQRFLGINFTLPRFDFFSTELKSYDQVDSFNNGGIYDNYEIFPTNLQFNPYNPRGYCSTPTIQVSVLG